MITERKDVYEVQIIVKGSVNIDNLNITFDSITMYNEDEEDSIVIANRQYDIYKERCSEGIRVHLYIVNDGSEIKDRLDLLVDEEYLISEINIKAIKESTGEELPYELVLPYGEQTVREIKVQVDEKLELTTTYLTDRLTEGNQILRELIFNTLKESEDLQDILEIAIKVPII